LFFLASGIISGNIVDSQSRNLSNNRYRIITVAIILLILALTVWQLTAHMFYKKGILFEAEEELEKAAETYDQANRIYFINSMAYSFASNAYRKLYYANQEPENLSKALERSEKAVSLSPVDGNLHNQLGLLYWENGDLEEAEYHLIEATHYAAYRIRFFIDLGWFYIQQGHYEEAQKAINRGFELQDFAVGMHPSDEDREMVSKQVEMLNHMQEIINSKQN